MKAYIAGKITGDEKFREKFRNIKEQLEESGFIVLNPADMPGGMKPGDYMRIRLSMVDSADIVYILPDYQDSRGALIEFNYAEYIGKIIKFTS